MDFDNRKVYGDTSITDGLVSLWGVLSFSGGFFLLGENYHFYMDKWGKFLLGVIINNWRHIITFGGRGFIKGDYHYFGARL